MSNDSLSGAQEILRLNKKIGRTVKARMFFGTPYILTTDPALVKHLLLRKPSHYVKSETVTKLLAPILGSRGIFIIESGPKHRMMRRAIMPSFHASSLLKLGKWFLLEADKIAEKWVTLARSSKKPCVVDVFSDVTRMSFDVIVWTVFGGEGMTEVENQHLYDLYKVAMKKPIVDYKGFVLMRLLPFITSSRFASMSKEMYEIKKMIKVLVLRAKLRHEQQGEESSSSSDSVKPLVHTLLGDAFDLEESVDCVLTFLGAGQATSAVTACWLLYVIAKRPEYQEKIAAELIEAKFDAKSESSLERVNECRMLDNVCKETLRLHPPLSYAVRTVRVDDEMNGIELPRGYNVRVAMKAMQLDPEFWGDDSFEFVPERWEKPSEKIRERMSWLPFLYGERSCIGNRFAMLEIKACVACVVSRLELSVDARDPPARAKTSLGTPQDMNIYVKLRKPSVTE